MKTKKQLKKISRAKMAKQTIKAQQKAGIYKKKN